MYVRGGLVNKEIGFHTTTNLSCLSALGSIFERFLGNRCQVVWKSYSWLNIMGGYLHSYTEFRTLRVRTCMDLSTKRWTFTLSKFDKPFGVRFHFERFLRIDIGWCEGHTLGWTWQDPIHNGYKYINEKIGSHITENLTSLSAFGSILKIFEGTVSVNVRVVLWLGMIRL